MSEITSHTFVPGQQAYEAGLRSALIVAEQTGQPQALHRHRYGEPCLPECQRVDPDGRLARLAPEPPVTVHEHPGAAGMLETHAVTGSATPQRLPMVAPAAVTRDEVQRLDPMGYGDDPKSAR